MTIPIGRAETKIQATSLVKEERPYAMERQEASFNKMEWPPSQEVSNPDDSELELRPAGLTNGTVDPKACQKVEIEPSKFLNIGNHIRKNADCSTD